VKVTARINAATARVRNRFGLFSKWKPRAVLELSCRRKQSDWAILKCGEANGTSIFRRPLRPTSGVWILRLTLESLKTGELTISAAGGALHDECY